MLTSLLQALNQIITLDRFEKGEEEESRRKREVREEGWRKGGGNYILINNTLIAGLV
jgi:hypothetical protein